MTAKQLRQARRAAGLTIKSMSELLGVSWITIWRKERGRTGIPYVFAEAVRGIIHERAPLQLPPKKRARKAA